jgi:hypothetical protein
VSEWPKRCRNCDHLIYPMSWMFAYSWSHAGRGLCRPCHQTAGEDRIDYERVGRSRDELMAEWEILRGEGYTKRQAAERLGMTFEAFDRAYHRARAAGDPRAYTTGERRSAS